MKQLLRTIIFTFLILASFTGCEKNLEITILHLNDTHSHVEPVDLSLMIDGTKTRMEAGGFARLSQYIATRREAASCQHTTLLLHAGDAVQGTLYFTKYHGQPEMEWLNWMHCDAMVTGNHEYDRGGETLHELIKTANFPLLAANVDTSRDPWLDGMLEPYTLVTANNETIAIIGLVSPDTPATSNPEETIVFRDPIEVAQTQIQNLQKQDIDKFIVLSHMGYQRDIELAQSVPDIDIVIGGHTHTFLGSPDELIPYVDGEYPTTVTRSDGTTAVVVQAGSHGRALGCLHVTFDGKGNVIQCQGTAPILVGNHWLQKNEQGQYAAVNEATATTISTRLNSSKMVEIVMEAPTILEKLKPYADGIASMKNQVIGPVETAIRHVRMPGMVHPATGEIMTRGSELAKLQADAMWWKAAQVGLDPDVGVQNAGGVRMDLPAGDLTVGRLYEILPFENTLFMLELTGAELKQCLKTVIERTANPDNDGAYPYCSHLRYQIEQAAPNDVKLTRMEIDRGGDNWVAVDPHETYRIATNAYLAAGRDGYELFGKSQGYRYDSGYLDAEIMMEFFQKTGVLGVENP